MYKNLLSHIKIGKEISTFGDIGIEKNKFYSHRTPVPLRDVNTEKVLVSNNIPFGEINYKYSVGYFYNDHEVKPLHIMLPKTSAYVKSYDGKTKWIYFLLKMMTFQKNIILFGIKSVLVPKRNSITSLSIIKNI